MNYVPYAAAAWILLVGLYGVVTSENLIHLIQCLAVAQSGSYVLLLAVGYQAGATAPVFVGIPSSRPAVDPVVQALTLTDVVVSVTVTALLLAIALQIHKSTGSLDPSHTRQLHG